MWAEANNDQKSRSGKSSTVSKPSYSEHDNQKPRPKDNEEEETSLDHGSGFQDVEVKPISVHSISADSFGADAGLDMDESGNLDSVIGSDILGEQKAIFQNLREKRGVRKVFGEDVSESELKELTKSDQEMLGRVKFSGASEFSLPKGLKGGYMGESHKQKRISNEKTELLKNLREQRKLGRNQEARNHDKSLERLKKQSRNVDRILEKAYSKVTLDNQVEFKNFFISILLKRIIYLITLNHNSKEIFGKFLRNN